MSYPPHGQPPHGKPQWGPPPSGRTNVGVIIGVIAGAVVLVLVAVVGVVVIAMRAPSSDPPVGDRTSAPPEPQGGAALQAIRDQGEVHIGVMDSPPYSWVEGGEATGSAPELARALFSELGVDDHEAVEIPDWTALQAALQVGEIDVIAVAGIYDQEACDQHALADPDGAHPTTFVVESGNPEGITDFEQLVEQDLTLGVLEESSFRYFAEEAGVDPDNMEFAPAADASALDMVADGEVDAFVSSSQWLRWLIEDEGRGTGLELTEPFAREVGGEEQAMYSGLVFAQEHEDILEDVNPILHDMRADGRLLDIGTPFGVAEDNLPPQDMPAEDACVEAAY